MFESEVVPLLAADERRVLEARTILGELDRRHPGEFSVRHLRTLQRRIRQWRALHGPDKEVYFPQEHPPGREAAFDFTNCDELGVTIGGKPFDHLLFELALSVQRLALADGGVERELRGAAPRECKGRCGSWVGWGRCCVRTICRRRPTNCRRSGGRALTRRYQGLLDHYGLESTRISPSKAHENGVVEQAHRRTKSILAQMLLLRGSRDFPAVEEYQHWVRAVVEREHNACWASGWSRSAVICARCRQSRYQHIPHSQSRSAAGARSGCLTGLILLRRD